MGDQPGGQKKNVFGNRQTDSTENEQGEKPEKGQGGPLKIFEKGLKHEEGTVEIGSPSGLGKSPTKIFEAQNYALRSKQKICRNGARKSVMPPAC